MMMVITPPPVKFSSTCATWTWRTFRRNHDLVPSSPKLRGLAMSKTDSPLAGSGDRHDNEFGRRQPEQ